jgi:hypothetical protein
MVDRNAPIGDGFRWGSFLCRPLAEFALAALAGGGEAEALALARQEREARDALLNLFA